MTESDVVECVRAARLVRVAGGGTSALPPRDGAAALSLADLRGVTDLRPEDLVVSARAGTPLRELDAALRERGRRLPLRPFDDGRGTVGGAVAAAADGLTAREGFRWRDIVLGLRAVLGNSDAVRVGASVVKSVAGYDVARALVGSRGCCAALTEVTLRVEPVPETTAAWRRSGPADEVPAAVAAADRLPFAPRGLVASAGVGACDVDVLLEGPRSAVDAAGARLRAAGFAVVEDPEARWAELTRRAAAPSPDGGARRVASTSRGAPLPPDRPGAVADVLRQRVTWIDASGAASRPADDAASRLLARVLSAFDPEAKFQAGRGFGAP